MRRRKTKRKRTSDYEKIDLEWGLAWGWLVTFEPPYLEDFQNPNFSRIVVISMKNFISKVDV